MSNCIISLTVSGELEENVCYFDGFIAYFHLVGGGAGGGRGGGRGGGGKKQNDDEFWKEKLFLK